MNIGKLYEKPVITQTRAIGKYKLYTTRHGSIHFLGEGEHGGKTQGQVFLENMRGRVKPLYKLPEHTLSLRFGFFEHQFAEGVSNVSGGEHLDAMGGSLSAKILDGQMDAVVAALNLLGMKGPLAMRSDGFEDKPGLTAAGLRSTNFVCFDPKDPDSLLKLKNNLEGVFISEFNRNIQAFYRKHNIIPEGMGINIQPLVCIDPEETDAASGYAPYFSLISATHSPTRIGIVANRGLGTSLVKFQLSCLMQTKVNRQDTSDVSIAYKSPFSYVISDYYRSIGAEIEGANPYFSYGKMTGNDLFEMDNGYLRGDLIPRLAKISIALEKNAGTSIVLEAATQNNFANPTLLQCRAIRKQEAGFPAPQIDERRIVSRANSVLGQSDKIFHDVVVLDGEGSSLRGLAPTIKEYLLLVSKSSNMDYLFRYGYSLFSNAGAIADMQATLYDSHLSGKATGAQHFAHLLSDEGMIYYEHNREAGDVIDKIVSGLKLVSSNPGLQHYSGKVGLYADEETGKGFIYK